MTADAVPCPECEGSGTTATFDMVEDIGAARRHWPCPTCDGSGVAPTPEDRTGIPPDTIVPPDLTDEIRAAPPTPDDLDFDETCERSPDGVHCQHVYEGEGLSCCWCRNEACDLEDDVD